MISKAILKQINADDLTIVEHTLSVLIADKRKSLAEIFKIKKSVSDTCTIPVLENVLVKNISHLSSSFLIKLFEACFRKQTDNYNIALLLAEEFIRRKDKRAQYTALRIFIMVRAEYKPWHRHHINNVHHALVTKYFTRFESNPLVFLLSWWQKGEAVFLEKELVAGMEALIPCAFSRVIYVKTFKNLLEILKFQMTKRKRGTKLIEQCEASMPYAFRKDFDVWASNNMERIVRSIWLARLKDDLSSTMNERIENAVNQINMLTAKEWKTTGDAFKACLQQRELNWHTSIKLLYTFIEYDDKTYTDLLIRLAYEDVDRLQKQLNEKYAKDVLAKILRDTLHAIAIHNMVKFATHTPEAPLHNTSDSPIMLTSTVIDHIRQWAETVDGLNRKAGRGLEIVAMIRHAFIELNFDYLMHALKMLDTYSGVVDLTERRSYFKTFAEELKSILQPTSTNQKVKVYKLLALNMHKIRLEQHVQYEIAAMLKKHGIACGLLYKIA